MLSHRQGIFLASFDKRRNNPRTNPNRKPTKGNIRSTAKSRHAPVNRTSQIANRTSYFVNSQSNQSPNKLQKKPRPNKIPIPQS